jgi:hypothetical protein
MAIIPAEEKVFMVSNSTNTTYSGSAALKAMQQWYTMEDVTNTVRPYQVFTALLTQSGVDNPLGNCSDDPQPLIIGVTYTISVANGTADFTNVGAPNNNLGTSFVATGTIPNSWGTSGDNCLDYNTGAPVATVLENTIGNVWFTYNGVGNYYVNSSGLFVENKVICSFLNIFPTFMAYNENILVNFERNDINSLAVAIGSDDFLSGIPIEIKVYN